MNNFFENYHQQLKENGIIPVICVKNQNELETLIKGLLPTSIRFIEILLRHPFSPDAIHYIKNNYPEFIVGAGTVVSSKNLKTAIESGADFCVSPGMDFELLNEAKNNSMPFLAGCSTPSEIQLANKNGIQTLKFFPAEYSGGVGALKLYESAFSGTDFIVTGGITKENFGIYLKCKNVLACGGGFMIPKDALTQNDSNKITESINECVKICKECRL